MNWNIPLFKVFVPPKEVLLPKMEEILYSGFLSEGVEVKNLEDKFRKKFDNDHVFATNSCTSGMTIAFRASGVGPGTSVIVTPQTCIASACPVSTLGAEIIWGDIDPSTGMLDPESVRDRIQSNTKAALVVHWGGDVAKIRELQQICRDKNIALIEDAAEALGAQVSDNVLVGQSGSDFTCFSFQAIKHLTTGDGGLVVCNSEIKCQKGKQLSWFGIDREKFRLPSGEINWNLDVPLSGFKFNMNNISGALGCIQFEYVFDYVIPRHVSNGKILESRMQEIDEIQVAHKNGTSAYWVFNALCEDRDNLIEHLVNRGIQSSKMHTRLDVYSGLKIAKKYPLPGVDEFSKKHLCLPCGWWMTREDINILVDEIKNFYRKR